MVPLGITNFPGLDVQIGLPGRVCLEVCGSAGSAAGCAGKYLHRINILI